MVLRNNGGDDLTVYANGGFTFATALVDGSAYAETVQTQPASPNQSCASSNGSGTLAGANVINVNLICTTNTYAVGGTVSGLVAGNRLVLQNNGRDDLMVHDDGPFHFATRLVVGRRFAVKPLLMSTAWAMAS